MDVKTYFGGQDLPKLTIGDLIRAYCLQKMMAEATLEVLLNAKVDQEELQWFREREVRRLEDSYKEQNNDL